MFQTQVVEKIKTQILCSINFFENYPFYEIILKNEIEPDRTQIRTRSVRIAFWIPKAN